jgi:hypothetical protein
MRGKIGIEPKAGIRRHAEIYTTNAEFSDIEETWGQSAKEFS